MAALKPPPLLHSLNVEGFPKERLALWNELVGTVNRLLGIVPTRYGTCFFIAGVQGVSGRRPGEFDRSVAIRSPQRLLNRWCIRWGGVGLSYVTLPYVTLRYVTFRWIRLRRLVVLDSHVLIGLLTVTIDGHRSGRADGPVRGRPGHLPVDGATAAKVFAGHAPAAAPHRRVDPAALGHLLESRHERPRLHGKVPRLLARHAGQKGKRVGGGRRPRSIRSPTTTMQWMAAIHYSLEPIDYWNGRRHHDFCSWLNQR